MLAIHHRTTAALEILRPGESLGTPLLLADAVSAGFPSPAQDCQDGVIDLNRELVLHPESTFCVRVRGDSMIDANLREGDILVVDRSLEAVSGTIAVCMLDGEFLVKRLQVGKEGVVLVAENPSFRPLPVRSEQAFEIWGVVTWALRRVPRR